MTTPAVLMDDPAPRIDPQALAEIEPAASAVEQLARELVIVTADDHTAACALATEWAANQEKARMLVEPARDSSHKAWKANVALYDKMVGSFERARRTLKEKIGAWREAEKKRADEEARKLREAAQRQVEDEALARALRAEKAGKPAEAEALLKIMPAATVVSAAPPPAAHGVATREIWSAQVDSLESLILWVAADLGQRRQYLVPVMPALNKLAQAMKGAMNAEPAPVAGVRAVSKHC